MFSRSCRNCVGRGFALGLLNDFKINFFTSLQGLVVHETERADLNHFRDHEEGPPYWRFKWNPYSVGVYLYD